MRPWSKKIILMLLHHCAILIWTFVRLSCSQHVEQLFSQAAVEFSASEINKEQGRQEWMDFFIYLFFHLLLTVASWCNTVKWSNSKYCWNDVDFKRSKVLCCKGSINLGTTRIIYKIYAIATLCVITSSKIKYNRMSEWVKCHVYRIVKGSALLVLG